MNMSDYEQYYQKGGTYVLPIELFNELFGEMESWKKQSNQLQSNWNSLRECIIGIIDGAREELNTIMQGDDLEYINQCSKEFDVIRKNLEIVLDKMNELEGKDNNENN